MLYRRNWTARLNERVPTLGILLIRGAPFVTGCLGCLVLAGFLNVDWTKPYSLSGDALFFIVSIKNAINGLHFRYNPYLGFPGIQDMLAFPLFEFSYKVQMYGYSIFTKNVFFIRNLVYATSVFLMYAGCYVSLRRLEFDRWLASLTSISFVISSFFSHRIGSHDNLALYYSVPFGATLALEIGLLRSVDDAWRLGRSAWLWTAIAIVGSSGLYYTFFSAMFISVAGLSASVARRIWSPLLVAAAVSVIIVVWMLLTGYGPSVVALVNGGLLPAPRRGAVEQLFHGMWPATAMQVYASVGLWPNAFRLLTQSLADTSGGPGGLSGEAYVFEWPGLVLTTLILLTPLMVSVAALRHERRFRYRAGLYALASALTAFGLIFAVRGGLGFVFNYLVDGTIRAQERMMPFLTFFAVVLFCLGVQQTRKLRWSWLRMPVAALLIAGLLTAAWPSSGRLLELQRGSSAAAVELIGMEMAMLAQKDAFGIKAVFQLPQLRWTEVAPIKNFNPYMHQLPYVLDRTQSQTRWSYGLTDAQPEFNTLSRLAADDFGMTDRARRLGFDAILIEKAAYEHADLSSLLDKLRDQLGNPACQVYDDAQRTLIFIGKSNDLDCGHSANALLSESGQTIGATNIEKDQCGYFMSDREQSLLLAPITVDNMQLAFWVRPRGQQAPFATVLSDHGKFSGLSVEQDGGPDLARYNFYAGDGSQFKLVGSMHLEPEHWYHVAIAVGVKGFEAHVLGDGTDITFKSDASVPGIEDFRLGNWKRGDRQFVGNFAGISAYPMESFSPPPREMPILPQGCR